MRIRTLAASAALGALVFAAGAQAQEITGGVAGIVTENGKPAAGAKVTVTNVQTGVSINTTTGDKGFYSVANLPPGGPYAITATAGDNASETSRIDSIPIGPSVNLDVAIGAAQVQEVTVTASPRTIAARVQTGPRTAFTATDIATKPSFAGDLKDLARLNPFVTVDLANSNSVIIAGTNNHLNTIYLDGVRQSDDFGLNNNGYPTQRSPFSVSVVQAFNLEVAPYDVQYGNFQGGIFNVVTKSGGNTFHGSAEYDWDSNRIAGKVIGGTAIASPVVGAFSADRRVTTKFNDKAYTFTFGGPIIKDRLFFFFGYDQYNGIGAATFNPQDRPGPNPIAGVNQSDVVTVQNTLKLATGSGGYGYDPLNYGGTGPVTDVKWFGKVDWYITDKQHLFLSYQKTDGTTYNVPNGSTGNQILNLQSNDYNFEQLLTVYTGDLVSHWTSQLSTEVEYSYKDVESPTVLFTGPFAEFKVQLPSKGSIFLGPDISRQANNLSNIDQQLKLKAHYDLGQNIVTGGYEWERLKESDLFVQNATGAYTFSSACGAFNTLVNLANHVACSLTYQNAFDNNPKTAATSAINYTNTAYIEDEWHATPDLTVRAGVRFEYYSSASHSKLNPRFVLQYGFANNGNINGENLAMPRFGFNWTPDPTWTISGGVGLFSGGNPGVYAYNSFTNPGNLLGTHLYTCTTANCATDPNAQTGAGTSALVGVAGSSIPLAVQQDITASANAGTGIANALDPHFRPPATWKASVSVQKYVDFGDYAHYWKPLGYLSDGWRFHGDFLYNKVQDAVLWQDIWELQNLITPQIAAGLGIPSAVAPDGRPMFDPTRYSPAIPRPWLAPGVTRTTGSDILLTDTTQGDGFVWALGVQKSWRDIGLDIDYTYTGERIRDNSPATSSVATSNYNNFITSDPNFPALATSNYQIAYEHRVTIDFSHKFFGDYRTVFSLFVYSRAGLPFSYAFCTTSSSSCTAAAFNGPFDQLYGQSATATTHQLLYVPKTDGGGNVTVNSDPLVTYGPGFPIAAFNTFLHQYGLIKYAGQISPRNAFRSPDVFSGDLHIAQELPAWPPKGAKGEFFIDIINVANLLNKNWGIDSQVGFPYVFAPIVASNCVFSGLVVPGATPAKPLGAFPVCAAGRGNFYQYNTFRAPTTSNFATVQTLTSPPIPTWVLKFGIRYMF